ncbi:hypothetical protein CUMW_039160 [Citrus unshiu]|nr:hypothetical protein CUMW_039160 [Citrus unshiu]
MAGNGELEETNVPLLEDLASKVPKTLDDSDQNLPRRVWMESKKLWYIDGPTIFSRLVSYSMLAITLAFAGHLGDLELAAISIVNNVVIGFDFGLLKVSADKPLGPKNTTCWEFTCNVHRLKSFHVLHSAFAFISICISILEAVRPANNRCGRDVCGERFLQCQLKNMVIAWVSLVALLLHILLSWLLVYRVQFGVIGTAVSLNFPWWLLVLGLFGYVACGGCPLTWTGFWEFIKLSAASGVMLLWAFEHTHIRLRLVLQIILWLQVNHYLGNKTSKVRIANELVAGNGKGDKFATAVSVVASIIIEVSSSGY